MNQLFSIGDKKNNKPLQQMDQESLPWKLLPSIPINYYHPILNNTEKRKAENHHSPNSQRAHTNNQHSNLLFRYYTYQTHPCTQGISVVVARH